MKVKLYLSFMLCLGLVLSTFRSAGQCPAVAQITNSAFCISLVWDSQSIPNPIPQSIEFKGSKYYIAGGLGQFGFPAVYTLTPGICDLPVTSLNGTLQINFLADTFNCQYGVLLASHDLALTVSKNQQQNLLTWTSKQNTEVKSFDIERSVDGVHFANIKTINASTAAGTEVAYSFQDAQPTKTSYYRLTVNEKDGNKWVSKIVGLRNELVAEQFAAYPNPNKGSFLLTGITAADLPSLSIVDMQGRRIPFAASNINSNAQTVSIMVKGASSGMLVAKYLSGNQIKHTRFIVSQ